MDTRVEDQAARSALALLNTAVDGLFALPLDTVADSDVLAAWRQLEVVSRRLAAMDHRLISQVQQRHLDFAHGATSPAALARQVLRIGIWAAGARVSAAEAAGPRRALTGEELPPVYERVAAAQAAGTISAEHARMIVTTIDALPDSVQDSDGAAAEQLLVEQAQIFDPDTFAKITTRLTQTLDPDGREPDYEKQQVRRSFRLRTRPDGSSRPDGELTAEATAHLRAALDALAKPVPADGEITDDRSQGQRDHDALLELVKRSARAELLPNAGGVTTTLILTCDADDWKAGTGHARTGHGLVVPTTEARRWVSGDTRVIGIAMDRMRAVEAYSDCRRIFSENQRLAMIVRDRGCIVPGCDRTPQHCEAHHIDEHHNGGPTSISNGCLICSYHHRWFEDMGWQITMINNLPHLIPPDCVDPERRPVRNTTHDPVADLLGG